MDKKLIADTLKKLKDNSPKRNFKQSLDLIMNLKGLDLKKAEHNVNMFVALQHNTGKKISICALVGPELEKQAKEVCDEVILTDQFESFKGKSEIKKLANKHDFFIAQANIMPKVATVFGRVFGPKGKMPNPKIGSVLPPNANVKPLYEKLKTTVNLATKNEPTIKCRVGNEDAKEEEVIDNILMVYNSIISKLPSENQNVKSVMLKLTMGPVFVIGAVEEKDSDKKTKQKPQQQPEKPKKGSEKEEPKKQASKSEKETKKEAPKPKKEIKENKKQSK